MPEIVNAARERLRRDQLALGLNIRQPKHAEIGPMLKACGFHWLFLDDETSPLPGDRAHEIALTATRTGITPLVRVRRNDPAEIGVQLSNGAMGVIVPHVNTADEAEAAARAARFPPDGDLAVPGSLPQLGYDPVPFAQATRMLNDLYLVVAMIETSEAVANADAIAAVPGVDVLFIGFHDLTQQLGIPSQDNHPEVVAAVEKVCAAARKHGKYAGMGGVETEAAWGRFVGMGMRFILAGHDFRMMMNGAKARAAFFEGLRG
ncbi:MAG: aldolase/citrate lyase family protein [Acetobacterales bacterium]